MSLNTGQHILVKYTMPNSTPVRTPLGTFASAAQAARAHHCDRSTILNRVHADPENYVMVVRETRLPVLKSISNPSWTQYWSMNHDQRDAWYQAWCQAAALDPDHDRSGDAFFAALDAAGVQADQDQDTHEAA
jgi:hypothetical protein